MKKISYIVPVIMSLLFVLPGQAQFFSADEIVGEWVGYNVLNEQGEEVGDIEDIVIDSQNGEIAYVVLEYGGLLGIGARDIAIPWEAFNIDLDQEVMYINLPSNALENAPQVDEDNLQQDMTGDWDQRNREYYEQFGVVYIDPDVQRRILREQQQQTAEQQPQAPVQNTQRQEQQTQQQQQRQQFRMTSENSFEIPIVQGNGSLAVTYDVPNQLRMREDKPIAIELTNNAEKELNNIVVTLYTPENIALEDTIMRGNQQNQQNQQQNNQNQQNYQQSTDNQLPQIYKQQQNQQTNQQKQSAHQHETQQTPHSWTINNLKAGQTQTVHINAVAEEEGQFNVCLDVAIDQPKTCQIIKVVQPELELTRAIVNEEREPVDELYVCDPFLIKYTLTNKGTGTTQTARITEQLPSDLQTQKGTSAININVGQLEADEEIEEFVAVESATSMNFENRAKATTTNISVHSDRSSVDLLKPELSLQVQAPNRINFDEQGQMSIRLKNTSNDSAIQTKINLNLQSEIASLKIAGDTQQSSTQARQNNNQQQRNQQNQQQENNQQNQQQTQNQQQQRNQQQIQMQGNTITIGKLSGGETKEIIIQIVPQDVGTLNGEITASAYCVDRIAKQFSTEIQGEPKLQITKNIEQNQVYVCDPVTVNYTIKNTGPVAAKNVTVQEQLPDGLQTSEGSNNVQLDIGNLDANESVNRSIQLRAQQSMQYQHSATAKSEQKSVQSNSPEVMFMKPQLSFSVNGPSNAKLNQSINYNVSLNNESQYPIQDVTIVMENVSAVKNISVSDGNTQMEGRTLDIGTLKGGSSKSFDITLTPEQVGELSARFIANGYCVQQKEKEISTHVEGIPALMVEMVDVKDPVSVDDTTAYEISIKNQGSGEDMNVALALMLPQELEFVDGEGDTEVSKNGDDITFGKLESIDPGEVYNWRINVRAVEQGKVRTELEMTSDATNQPVMEMEPTNIQSSQ